MYISQNLIQLDKTSSKKIECFIKELDNHFVPPLSSRVNIAQWSRKLNDFAVNIVKMNAHVDIEALISFYSNKGSESYITLIAVASSQRGKGLSDDLLKYCIAYCMEIGSTAIKVKTWLSNKRVIGMYHSHGFIDYEIKDDRGNDKTLVLKKRL